MITRESSFTYDAGSGLLTSETVEPNASSCNGAGAPTTSCTVTTTYQYDSFGNKTSSQVSGQAVASRTTSAAYSTNGQFKTGATNALNQSESYVYSASFGTATSHTGPNGVTTTWAVDTFGRQQNETRADGTETNVTYAYCSGVNGGTASCPANGAFLKQVMPVNGSGTQIGPTAITYYDALSRTIGTSTQGFDGSGTAPTILTTIQYNANGQVAQASRPYFSGGTPKWTSNSYDALGRVTQTSLPNGGSLSTAYNGLSTSTTNDHGQTTNTVNNAQGLKASVTDAAGNTTFYAYDAEGDLLTVTDANGNVTTNTYDLRGRKIVSSDPDMGTWTYQYDVLGELVSQTDAKNTTTNITYDVLGRMVSRAEGTFTSNWIYDTAAYGIGKLAQSCTSSANNPTCTSPISSKSFTYDSLGRPQTTTLMVSATSYTYTTVYDGNGRVATVSYPSGFVAKYVYTSLSYVSQIVDSASGTAYWTANARDAELHLLQATAGNGIVTNQAFDPTTGLVEQITAGNANSVANFSYVFDTLGNLTSRSDTVEGTVENFCFDQLNRVTNYALGGSSCTTGTTGLVKSVAYDALGNITSKSDVGSYGYGNGAGPHAVTFIASVAGGVNGVVNPTFVYDANGNMTSGDGRSVTYTSFNMAASVTQGAVTLSLTYDSEHARITEMAPTGVTTYLNDPSSGAMSEKFVAGANTTWRDYIKADGKMIAVRFNASGTVTMGYFTLDHLGSVAVITDQTGAIIERDSYDAWGRRRNPNGSDSATCSITSETTRGYTGQEEMDQVCLVNMNARLYDPTIGRFMQADPTVEQPYIPQDLNRYTYVGDNPLSFTDPSGLCFLGCFWKNSIFKAIFGIALGVVLEEFALPLIESEFGITVAASVNQGLAGGIAGYATTGKLKSALIAGAMAFAAAEVLAPQAQADATSSNAQGATNVTGPATTDGEASAGSAIQSQDSLGAGKFVSPSGATDFSSTGAGTAASSGPQLATTGGFGTYVGQINKFDTAIVTGQSWAWWKQAIWALDPLSSIQDCIDGGCGVGGWAMAVGGAVLPEAGGLKGIAQSARLGRLGEDAVRSAYDIGQKTAIDVGNGITRVPDGLTTDALSEVKNVQYQGWTEQLQDYASYAQQNSLQFNLYLREGADLSQPLLDAADAGKVNPIFVNMPR